MNISNTKQHLTKLLLCLVLCACALPVSLLAQNNLSQNNTELLSRLQFNKDCNDIWGWTDENGTEYALVGLKDALAIVDLSDPRNPREVTRVSGPTSTWRDIKTWGNYAYVTNETGSGLQVIDLSNLSSTGRVTAEFWTPRISGLVLSTCHNIFIDEFGVAYLAGCNLNGGGPLFVDVATDPGNPTYIGKARSRYAHDVYVRDNLMYSSDIYQGEVAITDVSAKSNPRVLGSQRTPYNFTHNAWLSDDGRTVYTTDERQNAPVAAYRVADPTNISKVAEFRSERTVGSGVIPHNVHVVNDFLVISNYTDGVVIVDAKDPENLVEVANYDTESTLNGSFRGAWGAYPFLPSGIVLVSDIKNGLFVVDVDYKRASRLEGIVRDASTNQMLNNVRVSIAGGETLTSDFQGEFRTGLVGGGTVSITFSKTGYISQTVEVDLEDGGLTYLEIDLLSFVPINIAGQITDEEGTPIENAIVRFTSQNNTYTENSNSFGNFIFRDVPQNNYTMTVMAWGYLPLELDAFFGQGGSNFSVQLERGYKDDFDFDLGWTNFSTTFGGTWDRVTPRGIEMNGDFITPNADLEDDRGTRCYVTGHDDAPPVFQDEVRDGFVVLSSPSMDLTAYSNPVVQFSTWFFTEENSGAYMNVYISNGMEQKILASITESTSQWENHEFGLGDVLDITDNMSISFEVAEMNSDNPITEAGVDGFGVVAGESIEQPETVDTTAFYLEAECAMLGAEWQTQRYYTASNGLYAVLPWQGVTLRTPPTEEKDYLRFHFDITEAGSYEIYARIQANNQWHNSFWVRADDGEWISFEDIPENTDFTWNVIHDSARGDSMVVFQFEAGMHTLDFGLQEDGTRLDKIYVVTNNTIQPDGIGEEMACPEGENTSPFHSTSKQKADLYPNPTSDMLNIRFEDDAIKTVEVRSIKGKLLQQATTGAYQHQVDLSNYPAGLYILSVIDAKGTWNEQIVKQ